MTSHPVRRVLLGLWLLIATLVATGHASALTAPLNTGYGSRRVSGVQVIHTHYTLSADGAQVQAVQVTTAGNTSGSAITLGFATPAVTQPSSSCAPGIFSGAATSYDCAISPVPLATIVAVNVTATPR